MTASWQPALPLIWPAMTDQSVAALVDVATTAWRQGSMADQTVTKFSDLARRFVAFAAAHDVTMAADIDCAICEEFVRAPGRSRSGIAGGPALATMHNRRASLRVLFRTARAEGIGLVDPTIDIELPQRGERGAVRPLTAEEADAVQFFADRGPRSRHYTAVALLLAGVRTAEAGWLTVADLDLDAGTVRAHGSAKYQTRVLTLDEAVTPWLRARVRHLADPEALVCAPISGDAARRQSLIGMTVGAVLREAGLGDDREVTPTSLTATAGHRAFTATGRIEDAARVTGCRSLDSAATLIGYHWREQGAGR
ncbi:tyrosine-type recombinase/integrase [Gordonia sp. FQ]|uniref:tyrosine-type recombinase/integrase n=1 Tax=Gordonia sp. FQ TaxID=3446634 RepID=UPI003F837E5A